MYKKFDELFLKLKSILNTNEFACHKLEASKLIPVYKNNTTNIGLIDWKNFHDENPQYIYNDKILREVINTKKSISINNLDLDDRNYPCFKKFNIKSIYVIPIIKENLVVAFIVIPYLFKYYNFTSDKKIKCENLIKECTKDIIKLL